MQDYNGFHDDPSHEMVRPLQTLTTDRILLPACPLACTQPTTPISLFEQPTLPPCTGRAPILGTFVASPSAPPPASLLDNTTTVPPPFEFVPSSGCTFDHPGLRHRNHSECFSRPNRALLIGDSHARNMQDAAAYRFRGNEGVPHGMVKATESKTFTFGELELVRFPPPLSQSTGEDKD